MHWITLPAHGMRGPHHVRLPPNFKKSPSDFCSVEEFLESVRLSWLRIDVAKGITKH